MIERGFARMFRNFSTLFTLVAVVVLPAHVVYTFAFRDVVATSDFHESIRELPETTRVGGVGARDLDNARLVFWLLTLGELALIPFAVRATGRVFEVDTEGGVPTATDAWTDAFRRQGTRRPSPQWIGPAVVGLAAAIACGLLLEGIGGTLTGFLTRDWRWIGEGMTQGMSRAGALPFFLGPMAEARAKGGRPPAPKLY